MKKLIIMGLAFLAFALVGCEGKDNENNSSGTETSEAEGGSTVIQDQVGNVLVSRLGSHIDYFVLIRPDGYSDKISVELEDGDNDSNNNPKIELRSDGDCVKVHKTHLPLVKVLKGEPTHTARGSYYDYLCTGIGTPIGTSGKFLVKKCELGVYKVNPSFSSLDRFDSGSTDCPVLQPISN